MKPTGTDWAQFCARHREMALIIAVSLPLAVSAGDVAVPHTFSAGQKALASEINENFDALEAAVNEDAQALTALAAQLDKDQSAPRGLGIVVAGQRVGSFLTGGPSDPNFGFGLSDKLVGISDTGYFFEISIGETEEGVAGMIPEGALMPPSNVYFTQFNCVGQKYLTFSYGAYGFMWRQGFVVGAIDPADAVKAYRAKGSPMTLPMLSVQSRIDATTVECTNLAIAESKRTLPLVPNDPGATGLRSEMAGPVQILPR